MSREMKIPPRTMSRITKVDLDIGAYQRSTAHKLTKVYIKLERQEQRSHFSSTHKMVTDKSYLQIKKIFL